MEVWCARQADSARAPAWRKASSLKWTHPARTLHEHTQHQRLGHAGRFELAIVDFPECRERQHDRLQGCRDGLLDLGRSDRQRLPGLRRRLDEPSLDQLVAGQRGLHFNPDQPRRPGQRVFRRLRLQRHALSDAQWLLHARRLRQPRQQRRLLPDGGERPKRRFAPRRKLADRSSEGQRRQRRSDRDADHERHAHRQSAVHCDAGRRRQSAVGQFGKLDLYRSDVAGRLRQSRRVAHDQFYFTNTGSNSWEVDAFDASKASTQRRFSLFVGSARDADPHLQSDDWRAHPPARRSRLRCRTGRR